MNRQIFFDSNAWAPRSSGLMLQRKCDCGQHTTGGAECGDCRKKKRKVQLRGSKDADPFAGLASAQTAAESPAASQFAAALGHDSGPAGRSRQSGPAVRPALRGGFQIQRAPVDGAEATTPAATVASPSPAVADAGPAAEVESAPEEPQNAPGPALLVEDNAPRLGPGQMRKSDFLAQLRSSVCAAAESTLAANGQTTDGCPYIGHWFNYYAGQSSGHLERAIHKYAPETRRAASAAGYIPLVAARVRSGVETWARTGELTGVPEGVPLELPGVGGLLGGALSALGGLFFKAREGTTPDTQDPETVQTRLGDGRPLDAGVRSRMESVFGGSFSGVRTHTDGEAAEISGELNARAFTVGEHVAFGAGEYRPGTPVGDALIAHELAHVTQQQGGSAVAPMKVGSSGYNALEEDADEVAMGAVASLWGAAGGKVAELARNAIPRLRSGLSIQRCSRPDASTGKPSGKTDLAALCAEQKCLDRSGCKTDKCQEEAKTITDTYTKRVKSIRRPDMPNQGDRHWGWLCYQWAGLLQREFEKLSPKCWQIRWVGIVSDSSGSLLHNYVFTSLGDAAGDQGPVRDCGVILDPWRTGDPRVYGGEWDWHKWNYIHDTKNNTGRVFQNGKWNDVKFTPGPTQPPLTTPEPAAGGN